jgi:hypothetical protein
MSGNDECRRLQPYIGTEYLRPWIASREEQYLRRICVNRRESCIPHDTHDTYTEETAWWWGWGEVSVIDAS